MQKPSAMTTEITQVKNDSYRYDNKMKTSNVNSRDSKVDIRCDKEQMSKMTFLNSSLRN
jgi:hypothetical protein